MGESKVDPNLLPQVANAAVEKVYGDILAPAGRQVGELSEDLFKAFRLFTAPIQFLASYQDRLKAFLKKTIEKAPVKRQVESPAEIAGPVLERIKYLEAESEVAEMFSNLLAASIDTDRVDGVQASFVSVLSQLSAAEARFLTKLFPGPFGLKTHNIMGKRHDRIAAVAKHFEVDPKYLPAYLSHLESLGILVMAYDSLRRTRFVVDVQVRSLRIISFSPYGNTFMRCCLVVGSGA